MEQQKNEGIGVHTLKDTTTRSCSGPFGELPSKIEVGWYNTFIGENAGSEITDSDYVVIIGDNIKNLNPEDNRDVIFLGEKVAIGKTVFGKECNLYSILKGV